MSKRALLPVALSLSLIPLAACVVSIGGGSCSVHTLHGSGVAATQERPVPVFTRVEVHGSARVTASVGGSTALRVTGDDNLLPYVTTNVEGETLVIAMQPGSYSFERGLEVEFATPRLESFAVSGSADAELTGFAGGPLALSISGSGDVRATGSVDELRVSISGSGDMRLEGLEARSGTVAIAGSGDVQLNARESLDVSITGSGDVRYSGQPSVRQQVTGSGSISRR
jgi:hypothetical protein